MEAVLNQDSFDELDKALRLSSNPQEKTAVASHWSANKELNEGKPPFPTGLTRPPLRPLHKASL